jgi:hypothetical protein
MFHNKKNSMIEITSSHYPRDAYKFNNFTKNSHFNSLAKKQVFIYLFIFPPMLWCSWNGDHPWYDIAKIGDKKNMKV